MRPMNGFWNALFEALGAYQGMSLMGPTPIAQDPSARSSARRASSSTPSPNFFR